jgi:hypothetical protein
MQIIHQGNISEDRAKEFRGVIFTNIIIGLKAIASQKQDLDLQKTDNYKKSRLILSLDESLAAWNDEKLIENIKSLWADEGFRQTWKEIKDSVIVQLDYFMADFDRYLEPDFIPTNDDILRARQRTTGEDVYAFEDDKHRWEITDVGGQFAERQKWNNIFTEKMPHAIIFFLALDDYNNPNTELKTADCKTKFDLSLKVFTEHMCEDGPVVNYEICRIVFLNKVDLFEDKIADDKKWADFKTAFGYNGSRDANSCTKFIQQKLLQILESSANAKNQTNLKIHVTNALDTAMMSKVVIDIKASILEITFDDIGWNM